MTSKSSVMRIASESSGTEHSKRMFETNGDDEDGGGTVVSSDKSKYSWSWRVYIFIGKLVSRKKNPGPSRSPPSEDQDQEHQGRHEGDEEQGLPPPNIRLDSAKESSSSCSVLSFHLETQVINGGRHGQEASESEADGFLNVFSKNHNSITRSFGGESGDAPPYVPLPPRPPEEQSPSLSIESFSGDAPSYVPLSSPPPEEPQSCSINITRSFRGDVPVAPPPEEQVPCYSINITKSFGGDGQSYAPLPPPRPEEQVSSHSINITRSFSGGVPPLPPAPEEQVPCHSINTTKSFSGDAPSYVPPPPPPPEEQVPSPSDAGEENPDEPAEEEQERLRDTVSSILRRKNFLSRTKLDIVECADSILDSNSETGIGEMEDAGACTPEKRFLHIFLDSRKCNRYTIFFLLISAGLSFSIDIMTEGPKNGWYAGAAILVSLLLLVTVPSVSNFRRSRKLQKKLWDEWNKSEVTVVRCRQSRHVPVSGIVVADIVCLKKDDRVPADGLLVDGENLVLDEVLNPKVDCYQNPFLFSGSKVKNGHGRMLVTSVRRKTALGKVRSLNTCDANGTRLLERRIDKPTSCIDNLALCVSVLISLVALIRLSCKKNHEDSEFPEIKGHFTVELRMKLFVEIFLKPRGRVSILTNCLVVLVMMFQHGMPLAITLSLSYLNDKVKRNQAAEPQNLSACCTMGLVTVICIDVTSGIMCTKLEVEKFCIGKKVMNDDMESDIDPIVLEALQRAIGVSVPEISVSPTNDVLISWAKSRLGMDVEFLDESLEILECGKLSSNKKVNGILMKKNGEDEKIFHLHWKGPASIILDMCSHYYDSEGILHIMKDQKETFEQQIKDMEDSGLRPIAFAYRQTEEQELKEDGLNLLAVVGVKYACQEETKSAVEALRNGGVNIKLVSEDELSAVRAIADELGFFRPNSEDVEVEGEEIQELPAMLEKVDQMTVMGSILPEGKLLLVQALQQKGQVVAFFGGSTTMDTAALTEADVGITERSWSTDTTRESSDIIIADNGFNSLISIMKSGRCAYLNIQKFTQLQLTACLSGSLIIIVTTMVLGESPINSIHLIWVNFIICFLGGAMMVMELPSHETTADERQNRNQSLITKIMQRNMAIQISYQAVILLISQFTGLQKVMISNSFTLCQVFNLISAMDLEKKEVLMAVLHSYRFLLALGGVMLVQVLFVELEEWVLDGVRLGVLQLVFCFLIAALSWGFGFAVKFITTDSYSTWSFRPILHILGHP